jgi:hypothetical protein
MQEDIRGLKDLIHIPYPLYYYAIGAALTAALLFLVALLVRKILRKLRKPKEARPPRPLHETILQELSDLRQDDGDEKRFHFRLSEIVRRYLEGRFRFAATDSTTEEILSHLPRLEVLPEAQKGPLIRLLKETDSVKFANQHRTREEAVALVGLAEAFVRETTPAEGKDA